MQRQLGSTMAVEANYVFTGGRGEENTYNINLAYNPQTGTNYPFSDISRRPFPEWGLVNFGFLEGYSNVVQNLHLTMAVRMEKKR